MFFAKFLQYIFVMKLMRYFVAAGVLSGYITIVLLIYGSRLSNRQNEVLYLRQGSRWRLLISENSLTGCIG